VTKYYPSSEKPKKVVMAAENTTGLIVEKTYLAGYYYNLDLNNRQKTLSCIE